jgi:hypothetical protein
VVISNTLRSASLGLLIRDNVKIEFDGDIGSVGRLKATSKELQFDLKGSVYRGTRNAGVTACLMSVGGTEAKIEAVFDGIVDLTHDRSVFESEVISGACVWGESCFSL